MKKHLGVEGRPDIHLAEIKLNIEVKLDSEIIIPCQLRKIEKQVSGYAEYNETVVVSLNGKPAGWGLNNQWFNPEQLFDFILEKCESNLTPN